MVLSCFVVVFRRAPLHVVQALPGLDAPAPQHAPMTELTLRVRVRRGPGHACTKHWPCRADNVPPVMGPRHGCWRGGGIRRKAHEVAWTRISQATQHFPFHATLSLPRNAFPSTQHFPFRATPTQPQAPRATRDAVRTCESFPDQGYEIGTCYHGTCALHLWAPLHSKWPQKSSEEGTRSLLRNYLRWRGVAETPQHNRP